MQQTVLAGQAFDERAEVHQTDDLAGVSLADFDVLGQVFDLLAGCVAGFGVGRRDEDQAGIVDVDLRAGLGDDAVDGLAALADDDADLVRIDLHARDERSVLGQLFSGLGDLFEHLAHDVHSAFLRLLQSLFEDLSGQAVDLDVHLDGGDAFRGAGHLEVHVAQEVFHTLDIGQDGVFAGAVFLDSFDQTHGDAGYGSLNGHACVHQREAGTASGSHGRRTVGGQDLGHDADRVREFLFRGQHGQQRSFRQRAVADLSSAGASQGLGFAGAVTGEVVLVHVSLAGLFEDAVEGLAFGQHAERRDRQGLRLASLKQAGAVDSGQNAGLDPDGTDLVTLSGVGTDAFVQDHAADLLLGDVVEDRVDVFRAFGEDLGEVFLRLDFDGVHVVQSFLLIEGQDGLVHLVDCVCADSGVDLFGGLVQFDLDLFLADFLDDLVDERDDLLDLFVGEHDGVQHFVLGNDLGAGFDHHDGFLRACDGHVDVGSSSLLGRGVDDESAVHSADDDGTGRAVPGNVGDRDGDGGTDHGAEFGRAVVIHGHAGRDDLDVVIETLGEQRAERSVHQTGRQDGLFRRSALSLDESAGDLAGCVELFFEVAGKREEIHAFSGGLRHGSGAVDHGIAVADPALAVGLFADLADLDFQQSAADGCAERSVICKSHK